MSNKGREIFQASNPSTKSHRADIDGLRAVAIAGVIAYHFGLGVPGGYGGVDVFFVISGFLIAGLIKAELDAGSFSLANFYMRRIRRIMPALTVCTLATAVAASVLLFPNDFRSFGGSLSAAATSTSNFYFMNGTGYFEAPATNKPLLHTWSLSVEEQFYAVFPLLLLLLSKTSRKIVVPVLAALAAISLAYSVRDVTALPQQAFFSTWGRIWELLFGALLAFGSIPDLKSRLAREVAGALGVLMIAFAYFFYSDATEFPGLAAVPLCVGAVLIIHSGSTAATAPTAIARCLSSSPFVALGLISYSVYLWHWPLMVFFKYRFPQLWDGDGLHPISTRILLMLAAIGIGALSWRFVEQPFRRMRTAAPRIIFVSAAFATAGSIALSLAILRKPDWFQHWSPEIFADTGITSPRGDVGASCEPQPNVIGWPSIACRMGPAGVADTIVWGDSHAGRLAYGIGASGAFRGHTVLVESFGGCPPLIGATLYGRSRSAKCGTFNERVAERLSAPGIKRVILAARWGLYAEGVRGDDDGGATIYLSQDGVSKNAEIFASLLEATARRLTEIGLEVVIVGPFPENVFNPALAFARHRAWNEALPPETDLQNFLERERHVMPVLAKLATMPNVRVIYPHLKLCDEHTCRYSKDGRSLYRDSNHLNEAGLAELGDVYAELFAPPGSRQARLSQSNPVQR